MTQATLTMETAGDQVWDAIVVGGGPAGALAARQLAHAGARVLLVERKSFPRWKVCGACLNGQALSVLRAVGLSELPAQAGAIELRRFHLRVAGCEAVLPLPAGRALSRAKLDGALVAAAVTAGACFLPETQATVGPAQGDARGVMLDQHGRQTATAARIVLVAAGLGQTCLAHNPPSDRSRPRMTCFTCLTRLTRCRRLGLLQKNLAFGNGLNEREMSILTGRSIRTLASKGSRIGAGCVVDEFHEFYHEGTIFMAVGQGGYVGLVRLEDGRLNLAAAFDPAFVRQTQTLGAAAASVLDETGFPPLPTLQDAAWQGTVSLTRRTFPLADERVFLLGDAAGYVEPFTGEGIAWALASADAVTPLALHGIDDWEPELQQAWPAVHWQLLGRRQRLCRGLAWCLRHSWLVRGALEVLGRWPELAEPVIQRLNAPLHPAIPRCLCVPVPKSSLQSFL